MQIHSASRPVADRRAALGITQAQLSERAGINIRQVQKIERGEIAIGNLTFRNAARLAAALEISLDDFAACI